MHYCSENFQLVLQVKSLLCSYSVLAKKCSRKGSGEELAFYINRHNIFKHLPCNHLNTSTKRSCKLPNRIVSSISLRLLQPLKGNFMLKTQIFHFLCSLTVADEVTVGNQFRNKAVICTSTVAFKFKQRFAK